MAKAATDEQVQLRRRSRRRLIGAIALVTLIAVVLPWILESEPRPSEHEVAIQIPSPDSATFAERVVPAKVVEPAKDSETPKPSAADAPPQAAQPDGLKAEQDKLLAPPAPRSGAAREKPAATKEAATKEQKSAPAEAKKKTAERTETSGDGKQFVVQVGALADADRAGALAKDLAAKGLKAYTEVVATASGPITRVRVGPFPNRESAEQERARLKTLGVEGNVAPR